MRLSLSSSRSCFRLGYFCWFCFCLCFIPFAVCFTISLAFLCFLLSFCFSPPSVRNAHHFLILFSLCLSLSRSMCVYVCVRRREKENKKSASSSSQKESTCVFFLFSGLDCRQLHRACLCGFERVVFMMCRQHTPLYFLFFFSLSALWFSFYFLFSGARCFACSAPF